MKNMIFSALIALSLIPNAFAGRRADVEKAMADFFPMPEESSDPILSIPGVNLQGEACVVEVAAAYTYIFAGAEGEDGQIENGRWASANISLEEDTIHWIKKFEHSEKALHIRSMDAGDAQFVSVLPKAVSDLTVTRNSDGARVVRVRSGNSINPIWSTDYTCIIK
jgi:hypothetical protein